LRVSAPQHHAAASRRFDLFMRQNNCITESWRCSKLVEASVISHAAQRAVRLTIHTRKELYMFALRSATVFILPQRLRRLRQRAGPARQNGQEIAGRSA
jgi:hypothetical protein